MAVAVARLTVARMFSTMADVGLVNIDVDMAVTSPNPLWCNDITC
jgi:hypothetical protein